ncbi:MAG: protein phosphatase 2C domain-containing protein [Deltaproteobacteria bacterium]|nr:protein phosphatase 2C domain-containing protein [Deltaproteobacteria bacterium]
MALDAAARTHAGKVRDTNEDAFVCRPEAGLFAVVDGMGGEAHGEVAAAIAVRALAEVPPAPGLAGETALAQAMQVARERILAEADADRAKEGMGAVATAIRLDDDGKSLRLAHVGDTRAYLVHKAGVRLLTHDHVADGPAGTKRQVARDLGRRDAQGEWVETGRASIEPGDLLVLCSDGLTDVVPEDELLQELVRLRGARNADAVATSLVGRALARGGPDNVTVVAVRVSPFARGKGKARVPWLYLVLGVVFLALGGALVDGDALRRLAASAGGVGSGAVPLRVDASRTLGPEAPLALRPGTETVVAGERAFTVRGHALVGSDWTITARALAAVTIERSVIEIDRDLAVVLEPGAELLLRDVRVERGRIRVVAPQSTRVTIDHLSLPSPEALVVEGEGTVRRTGVVEPAPAGGALP